MHTPIALFGNFILMSAVAGWMVAQIAKIVIGIARGKHFDVLTALVKTGGMPSSHSAAVCALCTASAIERGFGSFEFAVTLVLAFIVMRDASGVRRAAGEQAKIINRMIKTLAEGGTIDFNHSIKEFIGHTPFQVFVGAAIGIVVPFLLMLIIRG